MTINLEAEAAAREENNAALIAALDENLIDMVRPGAGAYPKHEPPEGDHDEELTVFERDLA